MVLLPTPAELPLVMGVVGLRRIGRGRWHGVRSGCGGFGGRRTIRTRRTRGPAFGATGSRWMRRVTASPRDGGSTAAKKQRSFWKELPLLIGIALILALLIKTFLVQAFSIPSDSMQNTLQRGDRVLVDKLTPWFGSEPERGEVVVFHDPGGWLEDTATPEPNAVQKFLSFIGLMPSAEEKDLIKRVIAVGGDTVECKKNGPVDGQRQGAGRQVVHLPRQQRLRRRAVRADPRARGPDLGDGRPPAELAGLPLPPGASRAGHGLHRRGRRPGRSSWPGRSTAGRPCRSRRRSTSPGSNAAAAAAVPGALGVAGALPLVFWRRRRLTRGRTAG